MTTVSSIARDLVLTLDRRARRRVGELDSLRHRFGVGRPTSRKETDAIAQAESILALPGADAVLQPAFGEHLDRAFGPGCRVDRDEAVVKGWPSGVASNQAVLLECTAQYCDDLDSVVIIDLG